MIVPLDLGSKCDPKEFIETAHQVLDHMVSVMRALLPCFPEELCQVGH